MDSEIENELLSGEVGDKDDTLSLTDYELERAMSPIHKEKEKRASEPMDTTENSQSTSPFEIINPATSEDDDVIFVGEIPPDNSASAKQRKSKPKSTKSRRKESAKDERGSRKRSPAPKEPLDQEFFLNSLFEGEVDTTSTCSMEVDPPCSRQVADSASDSEMGVDDPTPEPRADHSSGNASSPPREESDTEDMDEGYRQLEQDFLIFMASKHSEDIYQPLWEYKDTIIEVFNNVPGFQAACCQVQRNLIRKIRNTRCRFPGVSCIGKEKKPEYIPILHSSHGRIVEVPEIRERGIQTDDIPTKSANTQTTGTISETQRENTPIVAEAVTQTEVTPSPIYSEKEAQTDPDKFPRDEHFIFPGVRLSTSRTERRTPRPSPYQRREPPSIPYGRYYTDGEWVTLEPRHMGCWNCGDPSHSYGRCRKERRKFCYRCGLRGVGVNYCPKCSEEWHKEGPYLEFLGKHVPRSVRVNQQSPPTKPDPPQ